MCCTGKLWKLKTQPYDPTKRDLLLKNFKLYKNTNNKLATAFKSDHFESFFAEHNNNSEMVSGLF